MEPATNDNDGNFFSKQVSEKEKRKLKALGEKGSAWYGMGMFGMVGWSVAAPSLLGAALGKWLDKAHPQSFSWTLTCLIAGLFTGCAIGWYWVAKEGKKMNENNDE